MHEKRAAEIEDSADKKVDAANKKISEIVTDANNKIQAAIKRAEDAELDRDRKIEECEARCKKDNDAAARARSEAEKLQAERQKLLNDEKGKINDAADRKIRDYLYQMQEREERYTDDTETYYKCQYFFKEAWYVVCFVFCVLWLVIMAVTNKYLGSCYKEIWNTITGYFIDRWNTTYMWSVAAGGIFSGLSNHVVATILYYLITIVVGILLMAIFYGLPVILIFIIFKEYFFGEAFDKFARWIMVGTGIFVVALSSERQELMPHNLVWWWIAVQVALPVTRYIVIPLIKYLIEQHNDMSYEAKQEFQRSIISAVVMLFCIAFGIWSIGFTFSLF